MIFRQPMINAILAGKKTVTRRPVKFNADGCRIPCRYRVGRDYALQGPPEQGSKARAKTIPGYRLRVLSVRRECLGELTPDEAVREGFQVPFDFLHYWCQLYGRMTLDEFCEQLVNRIEFELVEAVARG